MNSDFLTEIACPNCLTPIELHGRHQQITCEACGSHFILEGHICPVCQTYHRERRAFCRQCGQALSRTCQKCQTTNWAGDEYCLHCGAPLDIFEMLQKYDARSKAERLQEHRARVQHIKEEEEKASQRRMAEMMTVEKERQAEVARQLAASQRRDRQILIGVAATIVIFLVLAVLLVWISR